MEHSLNEKLLIERYQVAKNKLGISRQLRLSTDSVDNFVDILVNKWVESTGFQGWLQIGHEISNPTKLVKSIGYE